MDERRRRILTIISAVSSFALVSWHRPLYAKEPTPLKSPVPDPMPPEIARAEGLIVSVLKQGGSEDKSFTLAEILDLRPELRSISESDLKLAILDLRFKKSIEESIETPPRFNLKRSSEG